MTAQQRGVPLGGEQRDAILEGMTSLPAHPEVPSALDTLRDSGVRLAALTNGTQKGASSQFQFAGLADKLEAVFSADQVRAYKPAPQPYLYALKQLRTDPSRVSLVAAHAWDIAGAAAAGLVTVFGRRPGKVLNPLGPKPDIVVDDLGEFARNVIRRRQQTRRARSTV
jgi:2-haloacid dehalogenase